MEVPFTAIGVQNFPVHPIDKGVEYTVIDVSPDGYRFQAELPDGTLGWFPSKYVRIIEGGQSLSARNEDMNYDVRRREYEAAKRSAQEKDKRRHELRTKVEKKPQQRPNYRLEENPDEDVVVEGTSRMVTSKSTPSIPNMKSQKQLQTFTETRGFLANAPGFNKNMNYYIEEENSEQETTAPPPPKEVEQTALPVQSNKPGVYRVVEERTDGPKYTPSTELPEQYKNSKWHCHSCSSVNPPERSKCHLCGTPRGVQSAVVDSNLPAEGWTCASCKVANEANRELCIMCGTKYKPPKPKTIQKAVSTGGSEKKKKVGPVPGVQKKRQIVSKAAAPIELKYAKGSDIYNYKSGSKAVPGHGAGY